jgi:hypothetical protein
MKINEAVFSSDGTYVRLETDKGKIYIHKGKFMDSCPVNVISKVFPVGVSKEIQTAVDKGGYNQVDEVKKFIKQSK